MAVPAVRYTPNRSGFAQLMIGPEVRAAITEAAKAAESRAVALTTPITETGQYARSFAVVQDGTVVLFGSPRASVLLINTAPYAAVVEWGHRGHKGHRILGRAMGAKTGGS